MSAQSESAPVSRQTTTGCVERNFVTACPVALGFGFGFSARHAKLHDDEHFPPPSLLVGFPRLSRRRDDHGLRSVRGGGESGVPPLWSLHHAPPAQDMTAGQVRNRIARSGPRGSPSVGGNFRTCPNYQIGLSDDCERETTPTVVHFEYDRNKYEGYLGNLDEYSPTR